MVKKSIAKKQPKSSHDPLTEFTTVGACKNMITSRIDVALNSRAVTMVFEDAVEVRVEFKTAPEAADFHQQVCVWNARCHITAITMVTNPPEKTGYRVEYWIGTELFEKHFDDVSDATSYFEKIDEIAGEDAAKKTMFQLYNIGDEKDRHCYYWFRTNRLEFDVKFKAGTKVFVNAKQNPTPDFEPGMIFV